MTIIGADGLTLSNVQSEVQRGAKFVIFPFCISILVLTFKRSSKIHFIRKGESALGAGIGYMLISLIFGWWGIPWGPIYTIESIFTYLGGGKNVTEEVMDSLSLSMHVKPKPSTTATSTNRAKSQKEELKPTTSKSDQISENKEHEIKSSNKTDDDFFANYPK